MEGGGDEAFDPCECAWGHELAMRRLLSLLRQSQSHCTDTECYVDDTDEPEGRTAPDYYFAVTLMLVLYFFLHIWTLNNRRTRNTVEFRKPSNGNGANGTPPTPPPSTS